jgi:ankyrin repeat protein
MLLSWEESVDAVINVLDEAGLEVQRVVRAPYLCQGWRDPETRSGEALLYVLDDAVFLCTRKDDVRLPSSDSGYPLHDAVFANDVEGVQHVLAQLKGGSTETIQQALDEIYGNKLTALQMAAYMDHADVAAVLLSAGAPLETRVDGMGMTALHWAVAARGSTAVLTLLIGCGADLDARDAKGRTALHYTAARGHTEAAATLIAAAGAASASDSLGLEALSELRTTPLQLASEHGHVGVINQLVAAGANIFAAADKGALQPLHVAAAMGHVEAVSTLLAAGAAVDALDSQNRTPLALTASEGRPEAVVMLLTAGADRSIEDTTGRTAVDAAGAHPEVAAAFATYDKL